MNQYFVHRNGWYVVFELRPRIAARRRIEHSEFSAEEQQVWLRIVLTYHLDRSICRKIASNRSPVHAVIDALEHVRLEVVVAMIVQRRVYRPLSESRRDHPTHIGLIRGTGKLDDPVPRHAAIT